MATAFDGQAIRGRAADVQPRQRPRATPYTLMDRGKLHFVKIGRSRRIPKRAVVELAARGLAGLKDGIGQESNSLSKRFGW